MDTRRFPLAARTAACFLLASLAAAPVSARKLLVGPGKPLALPSRAAALAGNGDTVEIAAGDYDGDVAAWTADNLVLRGSSKYARLKAPANIPNGKAIWIIQGDNAVVENIEFHGARVSDLNGAGIRLEGKSLTVRHCYFHDNENGILGGRSEGGDILIEFSEFAGNGAGDGQSHNLYILEAERLVFRFNYTHGAKIGHNLKTRAKRNHILYNRISDGKAGTGSYAVDIPNGGSAVLLGNILQQGPETDNPTLVSFGVEGYKHAANTLVAAHNTFVNDREQGGVFVRVSQGGTGRLVNNVFAGKGEVLTGPGTAENNLAANPKFEDREAYDYRLTKRSKAIDKAVDAGSADGIPLQPAFQYLPDAKAMARPSGGPADIGAYEFGTAFVPGVAVVPPPVPKSSP